MKIVLYYIGINYLQTLVQSVGNYWFKYLIYMYIPTCIYTYMYTSTCVYLNIYA